MIEIVVFFQCVKKGPPITYDTTSYGLVGKISNFEPTDLGNKISIEDARIVWDDLQRIGFKPIITIPVPFSTHMTKWIWMKI